MRLGELASEAWTSARAQKVPTILVSLLVAVMCATTLLTVGRAAAAQGQVAARLESAGSRHLVVTDARQRDFLTAAVVSQTAGLSGVERAIGLTAAVDTTNSAIGTGGARVPAWLIIGDPRAAVTLTAGRWPNPGEALVSGTAQGVLGLDAPVGAITTVSSNSVPVTYPVVGAFVARDPYGDLDTGAVVAAPARTTAHRLDVITTTAAQATITQSAVLAVLGRADPSDLQVQSPASLAQVQADVLGDLAHYNRTLTLLVLLAGAFLVAVVASSDVLLHRSEIGRRRALGAPRWALTALIITRTLVGALAGAVGGTALATLLVLHSGQHPDVSFTAATAVLAIIAAGLAATAPAVAAAHHDPVRVLRTP